MVKPAAFLSSSSSSSLRGGDGGGVCASSIKYTGVRKRKWGKWVSEIRLPNSRERIWLGSYDTPEKAARAFDAALFCLRGNTAKFNFPHQPPSIPEGRSLPPSQIQAAAARYANTPPPPPPPPPSPPSHDHHLLLQSTNINIPHDDDDDDDETTNCWTTDHLQDDQLTYPPDYIHDFGIIYPPTTSIIDHEYYNSKLLQQQEADYYCYDHDHLHFQDMPSFLWNF